MGGRAEDVPSAGAGLGNGPRVPRLLSVLGSVSRGLAPGEGRGSRPGVANGPWAWR